MSKLVISQNYMKEVLNTEANSLLFARYAYNLMMAKKLDEAFDAAKAGVGKFQNYATGRFVLALCLMEQGSHKLAIEQLVAVLKLEPSHQGAMEKLAVAYEQTGDRDRAHAVANLLLRCNYKSFALANLAPRDDGSFGIHEILGEEINWEKFVRKEGGDAHEDISGETANEAQKEETPVETLMEEPFARDRSVQQEALAGKEAEIDDILAGLEDLGEPQAEISEEKPKDVAQEPSVEETPISIEDMFLSKEEEKPVEEEKIPIEEEKPTEEKEASVEEEDPFAGLESPQEDPEEQEAPTEETEIATEETEITPEEEDPFAGLEEPQPEDEEIEITAEEIIEEQPQEKPKLEIEDTIEAEVEEAILQGRYIDEDEEENKEEENKEEIQEIVETSSIQDIAADLMEKIADIEEELEENTEDISEEPAIIEDFIEDIEEESEEESEIPLILDDEDLEEIVSEIKIAEEQIDEEQIDEIQDVVQDDLIAEIEEEIEKAEEFFAAEDDEELESILAEEPIVITAEEAEIFLEEEQILPEKENEEKENEEEDLIFPKEESEEETEIQTIDFETPSIFTEPEEDEDIILGSAFSEDDFVVDENAKADEEITGIPEVEEEVFEEILSEKFDDSFENYKKEVAADIPDEITVEIEPASEILDLENLFAEEEIPEIPEITEQKIDISDFEDDFEAEIEAIETETELPQVLENIEQKFNEDEEEAEPISEKEAFENMLVKEEAAQLLPDHILTPTFAQIYLEQGQPYLAKQIYERLLSQDSNNDIYAEKLQEIDEHINRLKDGEEIVVEKKVFAPRRVQDPSKKPIKSLKGKRIKPEIREILKEEFKEGK